MPAGKTLLVLLAPWITQVAAFAHIRSRPRTSGVRSVARRAAGDCDSPTSRRDLFTKAASLTALAFPNAALALAQITAPAPDQLKQYDLPRNALQDAAFAQGMASGMGSYDKRADGCHLDRRTGDIIRKAGFRSCDLEYLELKGFGFLNPTVCGIATTA